MARTIAVTTPRLKPTHHGLRASVRAKLRDHISVGCNLAAGRAVGSNERRASLVKPQPGGKQGMIAPRLHLAVATVVEERMTLRALVAWMRVGILAASALSLAGPAVAQQAAQATSPPEKEPQKSPEEEERLGLPVGQSPVPQAWQGYPHRFSSQSAGGPQELRRAHS